jgi:uncharacterized protein (TIGR02246 family)
MPRYFQLIAFLAAAAFAVPTGAQSASADSAAIHEVSRQFSAAYVRGDAPAMAALYTVDGVIFPDRSDAIGGRDSIQTYWTLRPGNRVTRHVATPTHIRVEGDVAYDYGIFEVSGENGGQPWGPSTGKYVIVWRREPGGPWRIHLDIWNAGPRRNP